MSNEEGKQEKKDTMESLRSEIDELKKEVLYLKSSKKDFQNEEFVKRNRKMRRDRHRHSWHSEFRGLEELGNFINQTVCASVSGLNESLQEVVDGVMGTVSSIIESLDLDEVINDENFHFRSKPRRWRYGEEPKNLYDEKLVKPKILLDEKEDLILKKLENEKLTFTQLSEISGIIGTDLDNLLKYLKENGLVIQESSGLERFFITKFGKEHLSE